MLAEPTFEVLELAVAVQGYRKPDYWYFIVDPEYEDIIPYTWHDALANPRVIRSY